MTLVLDEWTHQMEGQPLKTEVKWVPGIYNIYPRCSMYGIFTYIWLIFMIHGVYIYIYIELSTKFRMLQGDSPISTCLDFPKKVRLCTDSPLCSSGMPRLFLRRPGRCSVRLSSRVPQIFSFSKIGCGQEGHGRKRST